MRSILIRLAPLAVAATVFTLTSSAHAQSVVVQPAPTANVGSGAPPGQVVQQPQQGEYVAPLQQQTQPSYVPQSVALSGPRIIRDYSDGDPIPPGYHVESRVRGGLIGGGLGMFGGAYLISVLAAAIGSDVATICDNYTNKTNCSNPMWPLYLPVVGPWVTLGTAPGSAVGSVFLVIDGLLQGAGAAMTIIGIAVPKTILVRNDLGSLQITPMMVGGTSPGLGIAGTF